MTVPAFAADDDQQAAPPVPGVQAPPPATSPTAPAPPVTATPAKPSAPDYPDPRTFTIGLFYWFTSVSNTQPDLLTGRAALDYETLMNLGKPRNTPGLQINIPISRTGEIKFEGFVLKGDGSQTIGANPPDLFGTQFSTGDIASSQYQIKGAKLYLDDLLFPHKFPVAKFRVKSLWEVQWLRAKTTIDAPNVLTGQTGSGNPQLILPEFGLAAEYAISPHVLLRASGAGFGLYHKADVWDADGTISYRVHSWEVLGGYKALHFKTSPQSSEYFIGTFTGAYVGIRYHL